MKKMCLDICLWSVLQNKQFSKIEVQGKLWTLRNKEYLTTTNQAYI